MKNKKKSVKFSEMVKTVSNGKWDSFKLAVDYAYSKLRFHVTADEYFKYSFYNLKNRYRKNFLLIYHKKKYRNISTRFFTRSKYVFYSRISDLYQREIILLPYCGLDEFLSFVKKHKILVAKPDQGSLGKGVEFFKYTDDETAIRFFEGFSKDAPVVLEEYITQHEKLNELNPFCVNTIRVVSILFEGEVEIVSATLKSAATHNTFCDNMYGGGIGANVDVETGVVTTRGRDFKSVYYISHPITGVNFVGFQVPNWENVVTLIKNAHKRLPQCLIYGWDIAVTPTGADIVEANNAPDTQLMQLMDQVPKGKKIIKMMKTIKIQKDYSKTLAETLDYEGLFASKKDK